MMPRGMVRAGTAAALVLALPAMASAQIAKLGCIERDEAAAVVTFALPSVVAKVGQRCRAELPQGAYLALYGDQLADRYRGDAAAAWPVARRVIGRLFSQILGQPMPAEMNGDMLRVLAEPALASLLAEKVKTTDCDQANEAMQALSSVSGRDIGRLASLGVAIADRKGNGIAGVLKVCRPGERG